MTDISDVTLEGLPTSASLLKATGISLVVAGALLVVAVLPAEYGIDPTGIGRRLGLTALAHASTQTSPAASEGPVWKSPAAYRTDKVSLTLAPDKGTEIKASMQTGDRLLFAWAADGGLVNFDMHGEAPNASEDDFTSYWKGRDASGGNGAFVAPFSGSHGWYWKNKGDRPVTITVETSGYYEKLYKP